MTKKILITSSLFLIAVIIGAGFYYLQSRYQNKDDSGIGTVQEQNNSITEQTASKDLIDYLNQKDASSCNDLKNPTDKDVCVRSYIVKEAVVTADLDKCASSDKALTDDCSAQASFSLAIQKRDKKYCAIIINEEDKDNCIKILAGMGVK